MTDEQQRGVLHAVRSLPSPCWLIDRDSRLLAVSESWEELLAETGSPAPQDFLPGARVLDSLTRRSEIEGMTAAADFLTKVLEDGFFPPYEIPLTFPTGLRWFIAAGRKLEGTEDLLITFAEITQRRAAESALHHQARHDALTGLANRSALTERLQLLSARVQRGELRTVALFFLDLDDFKVVNDEHGHDAGDVVLREVAARLEATVRATDLVCRLGGDEFVVVVADVDGEIEALAYAERLTDALRREIELPGGLPVVVGASCGIAWTSGPQLKQLLTDADIAMLHAKATGRHQLFDGALDSARRREADDTHRLQDAIEQGEIVPWYQPVVRLEDGAVVAAEALARWPGNGREIYSVISLAERTGLIAPLDRRLMMQVGQVLASGSLGKRVRCSVNASIRQVTTGMIVQEVADVVAKTGADPTRLVVEVTEHAILTDPDAAAVHLGTLSEMGVLIALDDFGTGYSSLSHLVTLPLHVIKIDKMFVEGVVEDARSREVVRAVASLGSNLGFRVVAEGVESAQQAEALHDLGCELAQGYHFGRPVAIEEWPERR